ncbi:MAG: hypothetical protein ACI97A_001601 [Planctomycetota bacterium]|jgi:hypothetical protein
MKLRTSACTLVTLVLLAILSACSGDSEHVEESNEGAHSSREGRGEHSSRERSGEHGSREGRSEHRRDEGESGEGEESGTEYAKSATYDKTRNGAHLILAYNASSNAFVGSVTNTTSKTLERVRVEVHLSNGIELGPTKATNLAAGQTLAVNLPGSKADFERWNAHPEIGNDEHGSGEDGEHR